VVNATGRDHPRRAGLAVHLGAVLGLPTVGVTTRPLLAEGGWPPEKRGATTPLRLDREVVGCWVRTRPGARPVAVHAAWRTDASDAVRVVLAATRRARTPEPCAAPAPWPEPSGGACTGRGDVCGLSHGRAHGAEVLVRRCHVPRGPFITVLCRPPPGRSGERRTQECPHAADDEAGP
jgi:Endonuclease V